jgi:predicted DNA-binding protein
MKSEFGALLHIRVSTQQEEWLNRYGQDHGLTKSQVIRKIIDRVMAGEAARQG